MKRLLFISSNDYIPWGGSEELWFSCAIEALKGHLEIAICTQWDPLPARFDMLKDYQQVKIFSKNKKKSFFFNLYNKFSPGRFRLRKKPYGRELIAWNPDLTIISQGNNADGLETMQFCKENNLAYCTISQAVYEGIWPSTGKSAVMREFYKHAIANYFVSKANLNVTNLQIGEVVKKGKVVRNPFNLPYHTNLTYPSTDIFKLACVARYEFYAKGQDVLLEVLSQTKWKERNIMVTFYGNGPNEDGLRRLISYFNLKNVFIGGHKQTIEIWKENHALVLPSRFEGLPLALVEAMLAGRFGIVSDVSGNKEAFIDGESGFLAEAPRAEYFDRAMEKAWTRRYEWCKIGQNAKQYIQTLFPENPGKELLRVISDDYSACRVDI